MKKKKDQSKNSATFIDHQSGKEFRAWGRFQEINLCFVHHLKEGENWEFFLSFGGTDADELPDYMNFLNLS